MSKLKKLGRKIRDTGARAVKQTGKVVESMAKDPISVKTAVRAGLAAATGGASLFLEGAAKGYDEVSDAAAQKERFDAIAQAETEQAALDVQLSASEQAAKRKAAEEQMARRRSTPGRPMFTSLINRGSLLS